jgi:hypothetical protein
MCLTGKHKSEKIKVKSHDTDSTASTYKNMTSIMLYVSVFMETQEHNFTHHIVKIKNSMKYLKYMLCKYTVPRAWGHACVLPTLSYIRVTAAITYYFTYQLNYMVPHPRM